MSTQIWPEHWAEVEVAIDKTIKNHRLKVKPQKRKQNIGKSMSYGE